MCCKKQSCGLEIESRIYGRDATELPIAGCVMFSIMQRGQTGALIGGQFVIDASCNHRDFPQVDGLEYLTNKSIEWLVDANNPTATCSIEFVCVRKKNTNDHNPIDNEFKELTE